MKTLINRTSFILLFAVIFLFSCSNKKEYISHADNSITVYCGSNIGAVNKKIFGNNFVGYDPMTYEDWAKEYYGYSDYGAGIWDPRRKTSVREVINLAKDAGISIARFPGGCGVHHYNWEKAIGNKREHFLYGLDEFLKTCGEINAEAVITVSVFSGNENDAAELVRYLNFSTNRLNSKGVKYYEIGNEVFHGDHRDIKKVSPAEYARKYLRYYNAMKRVDPAIKIGIVLDNEDWNKNVLKIVKSKVDFAIIHIYPTPAWGKKLGQMNPEEIFRISLAMPISKYEMSFRRILQLLKEKTGNDIPLAITEYNGGFVQDIPVPYRHTLGNALLNAELLRFFMNPEHNVLMANYWDFVNEYWGMITNGFDGNYTDLYKPYYKRPNFYVFELYHRHFGDTLIMNDTESNYYIVENNKIPYLSVNTSIDKKKNKVYVMVINKNLRDGIASTIEIKDFSPSRKGHYWILNGPRIDATNEENHNNIKIKNRRFKIDGNIFKFTFEPHSLTVIELEGKER